MEVEHSWVLRRRGKRPKGRTLATVTLPSGSSFLDGIAARDLLMRGTGRLRWCWMSPRCSRGCGMKFRRSWRAFGQESWRVSNLRVGVCCDAMVALGFASGGNPTVPAPFDDCARLVLPLHIALDLSPQLPFRLPFLRELIAKYSHRRLGRVWESALHVS